MPIEISTLSPSELVQLIIAVVGLQWGDEGKGKVVDFLIEHLNIDIVVRYQGGPNAGHTLVVAGVVYKQHQLPSGVLRDKHCVIANGCVVDLWKLLKEIRQYEDQGIPVRLSISDRAHLILPWHTALDEAEEAAKGANKIGTTGSGIGPCYADKASRLGVLVGDLVKRDVLARKVNDICALKQKYLTTLGSPVVLDPNTIFAELTRLAVIFQPMVVDTAHILHTALEANLRILLEGAQGAMLDLDHGTYPFVTSASTTGGAMCAGTGLSPHEIGTKGEVIGVVKGYATRVGSGPFPTELDINEGVGQRLSVGGNEIGTTTGRQRRCGWLDLVALKHGIQLCGATTLAVTKMDVITGFDEVKVCVAYRLPDGTDIDYVPSDSDLYALIQPIYKTFPGWENLGDTWAKLPLAALDYITFIESQTGCRVVYIGTGSGREQMLVRP